MFRLIKRATPSPAQPRATLSRQRQHVLSLIIVLGSLLAGMALISHASNNGTEAATSETTSAGAVVPGKVIIETSKGNITVELNAALAPVSVANFLSYVDDGFYNGTIFHRVIDGFMIQGGGFTEGFERKTVNAPIKNEANNGLANQRYTLAMARTNAPHSATAQFFINTVDNPYLDHKDTSARGWGYAVFGRIIDGVETVDTISTVETGPGGPFSRDAPVEPIVIKSITRVGETAREDTAKATKSE